MPFQPQPVISDLIKIGTLAASTDSVIIEVNGVSGIKTAISGTWVGTIQFQTTVDSIQWNNIVLFSDITGNIFTNIGIVTNDTLTLVGCAGVAKVRAIFTSYVSGSATITLRASSAPTDRLNIVASYPSTTARGVVVRPLPFGAATYSATISNLATAALATDIFTITGSATKTIRVTSIIVSGNQTIAKQFYNVSLLKRSSANSVGISTVQPAISYDSIDPAATAVVRAYTANPTLGTLVGQFNSVSIPFNQIIPSNSQTNGDGNAHTWVFGVGPCKTPILRGVNEVLAVNLNGQTLNGVGAVSAVIEWTEEG